MKQLRKFVLDQSAVLARLGVGFANMESIASQVAHGFIHDANFRALDEEKAKRELQRRYVEVALVTGLPCTIARQIADMAWNYTRGTHGKLA